MLNKQLYKTINIIIMVSIKIAIIAIIIKDN